MRKVTIWREDMNNELHGNLFDDLLENLGIKTHELVAGRYVDKEIDQVTVTVVASEVQ